MIGMAILAGLVALAASAGGAGGATSRTRGPKSKVSRWSEKKAWDWYNKQPWFVGFNYVPSTACNTTELWQAETFDEKTIDRELAWAEGLGFNTCRVFVQYLVWKHDPVGLKKRVKRFLTIAYKHGIRTTLVLFDDCSFGDPPQTEPYLGKQRDPIPGMILPSWTPSPGSNEVADRSVWPDLERYVKDMVGGFGKDRRVLMWDLYNEPWNSGKSLPLMEATFAWARSAKPQQPLTVSIWNQDLKDFNDKQLELSDIVSYHAYVDHEGMRSAIARYKAYGRPVICTEWMARLTGSKWETDLPLLKSENIGCYCWGLVNGRTQTQFPWWSKKGSAEPEAWFHDILHRDGAPYRPEEVKAIRQTTGAAGVPKLKPLFDFPVRDTCICLGPDGIYYLIGTTGHPTWWQTNEGIRIWKSKDLKKWDPFGLVWTFEKDGTWQRKFVNGNRAIWAPEVHYAKGTFWITYCVNYGGTGILRSTTGKAEGPYADIKPDGPLTGEIDASMFADGDGKVYFVYQDGKIARMKDDMTGLAEAPRLLKPANFGHVGFEGAFMFKANGRYYLSCAESVNGEYHCYVASSKSIYGPYGDRYLAIPHGGHNMLFKDKNGNWWSTFFGSDGNAPFTERPAILPVEFGLDGGVRASIARMK